MLSGIVLRNPDNSVYTDTCDNDPTACTPAETTARFHTHVSKADIITAMQQRGGAGEGSANGIYNSVIHCSEGNTEDDLNPDDPFPCCPDTTDCEAPADGVPIFKLHSYRKAIHGASTQIRYNRATNQAGYRDDQ